MAPQSTVTNGPFVRGPRSWMALAMSSLPVPLSPTISVGASVRATLRTCIISRRMLSLRPSR